MTDTVPTITVGLDTFISLDDANAVAAHRLFAAPWNASTDTAKVQALATATGLLNRLRWIGTPATPTQPLAWPRIPDRCPPDHPIFIAAPDAVAVATAELAIHLLTTGGFSTAPVQQQMLGDAMTMYFPTIADEFPKHVRRLIEPYLQATSANVAEVRF